MKKLIIVLIVVFTAISCKGGSQTSPSGGGGDNPTPTTKSWKVIGSENFSDEEASVLAFALSTKDVPIVAYSANNVENQKAIAMMYNGSDWVPAGKKGFSEGSIYYLSMVAGDNGSVYLAYRDEGSISVRKLTIAKFDGNNWITDVPETQIPEGDIDYTSLAVDKNNIPYIAYNDVINKDLATTTAKKLEVADSRWKSLLANGEYVSTKDTKIVSIAVHNETPYIAYMNKSDTRISVKKYDGNNKWSFVGKEDITDNAVGNINIAISDSGRIFIAYSDDVPNADDTINVLEYNGADWVQVGQKDFGKVDHRRFNNASKFFIVRGETPYIAFPDLENNGKATVMKFENNSWNTIGPKGFTSMSDIDNLNIALSTDNTVYVAYVGSGYGQVTVMAYK